VKSRCGDFFDGSTRDLEGRSYHRYRGFLMKIRKPVQEEEKDEDEGIGYVGTKYSHGT